MKLFFKIILSFLLIIFFIAAVDTASYFENKKIRHSLAQLSSSSLKESFATSELLLSLALSQKSAMLLLAKRLSAEVESDDLRGTANIFSNEISLLSQYTERFDRALSELWVATNNGFNKEIDDEGKDNEMEELEVIRDIRLRFTEYKNQLDEYKVIIIADPVKAGKFMIEVVIPAYLEIKSMVSHLNADAGEEISNQAKVIDQGIKDIILSQVLGTIFGFIVAVVMVFFIARRITQPIEVLKEAAVKIAAGSLNEKVPVNARRGDEINELGIVFNRMTSKLGAALENEKNCIAAAARAEVEVERQRANALEVASKSKSLFLSRVSHELRTPLNAIIGFSNILDQRVAPDALTKYAKLPGMIHSAGEHLLRLVDDILDMVQTEQGKMHVDLRSYLLADIVASSIDLCFGHLKKSDVKIVTTHLNFMVLADEQRLRQVVVNLLTNAIKYNRQGGTVYIVATQSDPDEIILNVFDTGVGIAEADRDLLFKPFSRLGYAETQHIEGTGIGLALTKQLVERMQGHIGFESVEGQGTRFYLKLKPANTTKTDCPITDTTDDVNVIDDSGSIRKRLILYIEDNIGSQDIMSTVCKNYADVRLLTCNNAEEGIAMARVNLPDLIFIDIDLPGIDGIGALKGLKNLPELQHSPVYALSAKTLPSQIESPMIEGFDDYFTKPISEEQISQVIAGENPGANLSNSL